MRTRLSMAGLLLMLAAAAAAEPSTVAITTAPDRLEFLVGKALVGRYNKGPDVAKPYMWPLFGPHDTALTRSWPMAQSPSSATTDHPHQKSLWFCHGDVIPEGVELTQKIKGVEGVDFWSEAKGHGRIDCTQAGEPKYGKDRGSVATHNEWQTADGRKLLDEDRTITLYDFGNTRMFVFDIDLRADVPVTFGDTKEGAFGVRVNDQIREAPPANKKKLAKEKDRGRGESPATRGKIENADGKTGEGNCWGRLSAWCDYSGAVHGKVVGIAILDHPKNPYPACWHVRGYGLMAANPFGRGKSGFPAMKGRGDLVKLEKGGHLKLRYGVLLHPGDARDGHVADYYGKFVELKD